MLKPFYNEETVEVDGETYRLVINFKTIDATESILGGRSYDTILADFLSGRPAAGLQARVVWGLLREHHPQVTLEQAFAMTMGDSGEAVGFAIGNLIRSAFPSTEDGEGKAANPPKRRGASKRS